MLHRIRVGNRTMVFKMVLDDFFFGGGRDRVADELTQDCV